MCQIIFVIHLKLNFLLPGSFLKFWGPLPLGGLRQLPNSPKGRAGPVWIPFQCQFGTAYFSAFWKWKLFEKVVPKKRRRSEVQSFVFLLDCVCYTIDPMVSQCGIPVVCVSALLHKSFLFAEKLFLSFRYTSHKSFFFPLGCVKFVAHPMVWMNSYFAFFTLLQ